jgi:tetratricopeptide (TPR) repeat protein
VPARYHAFLSYARADANAVRRLAENLHQLGVDLFFDEWEIGPGDVLVHQIDRGLLESQDGLLAVTPTALSRPWVQAEYAALMQRAVEQGRRIIPVLLADADMPPLLASRIWVDLRHADGPEYEARVRELAAALLGERPGPPPRTGVLQPSSGSAFRAPGPVPCRLRIGPEKVSLINKVGAEVSHQPGRLDMTAEMRLWDLERLRHGQEVLRDAAAAVSSPASQQNAALLEIGDALARAYLDGAAGEALRATVAEAERLGSTVELGLEIDDALATWPWEALRLPASAGIPGEPLALHPNVRLFRAVPGLGATPALPIPGPLRILVVIGSPEEQNARGELLDMERELERILDAVEPARKEERPAYVRILHRGTVAALREELARERFHVLHITCHAGPGVLVLEKEDGSADEVKAERLCREALVPDRGVPLVVLAGCATALSVPGKDQGEAALPGLARALLAHGVPAVLAMQAPVGDFYATALGARLYHALATAERADPLDAVSGARRLLETDRRNGSLDARIGAEWATPALYLRGPSLPLLDPTAPFAEIAPPPEPRLAAGVVVRAVGDFVGRRREERRLLQAIRKDDGAGLLLHGLGGIGKSSLAAETLRALFEEGWLVASLYGTVTPDSLLAEAGRTYLAAFQSEGMPENDPRRQLAVALSRPDVDWEERFDLLSRILLGDRKLIVLLDNFEDNQGADHAVRDEDLATLLARWLRNPGRTRFLITTRYPFELPDRAHRRLEPLHLGPLSFAETRKLLWRLPALDKLSHDDQLRAYADVGGHPRALEYLDALLRGGKARFQDVTDRMEQRLEERGIRRPEAWMKGVEGDLDRALAETVTLAVDDVLLDRLLERLGTVPLAKELLVGAAVYRVPVDRVGLAWQVGEAVESADEKDLKIQVPEEFEDARLDLEELGLLAPAGWSDAGTDFFFVHRWTASAVLARAGVEEKAQAHHRAARFWRWRVKRVPQSRAEDMEQLLEARHHHYEAGEIDEAVEVTEWVCLQFDTWGAYRREEQLCRETITWLSEGSAKFAVFAHGLGLISHRRGYLSQAVEWYQKAFQIEEEIGDHAGMASAYHQLGIVAQDSGDLSQALEWYQKALQIFEELGNRAGMASTYGQLGILAEDRGELDEAVENHQKALQIFEELGDRAGMASTYHRRGMIARSRGELSQALEWYQKSLQINEELGNRDGMASTYHEFGMIAQSRGELSQTLEWYQKSLQINEELGNRAGMANSYGQLAVLLVQKGVPEEAVPLSLRALAIHIELQSPMIRIDLHWLRRQRELLGEERFGEILREHLDADAVTAVLGMMEEDGGAE